MIGAEKIDIQVTKRPVPGHAVRSFLVRWRRSIPLAVFVVSILTTLMFWKALPDHLSTNDETDYFTYYEPVARSIMEGHGLQFAGEPATGYPPGYPFLLAGVFALSHMFNINEGFALSMLSAVCMALVSTLIFLIARSFWGPVAAILTALLWISYPFGLWLTKQPNTELPFMVIFYSGFALLWHSLRREKIVWSLYFATGILCGAAMLVRPIAIGIGFIFALAILSIRRKTSLRLRFLLMAVLLLGNALTILPWEAYLYGKTGRVVLLGTIGVNGIRDGLTFGVTPKGYRKEFNISPDVGQVMTDIQGRVSTLVNFKDVLLILKQEFQAHPLGTAKLFLLKAARSWYATDSGRDELPILLIQIPYLCLGLWGTRTLWRRGGSSQGLALSVLLLVFYFWGMTVLALSILRYMVPVMGLMFLLVAGGLHSLPAAGKAE